MRGRDSKKARASDQLDWPQSGSKLDSCTASRLLLSFVTTFPVKLLHMGCNCTARSDYWLPDKYWPTYIIHGQTKMVPNNSVARPTSTICTLLHLGVSSKGAKICEF